MYNDLIPMVHVSFQLDNLINNKLFLDCIDSKKRSLWDPYKKNIIKEKNDENDHERYTFKFPVRNREFYDRTDVKCLNNGIAVISFSEDSQLEPSSTSEQGVNIMTCISLERSIETSTIQAIFQIDLKLETKRGTNLIFAKLFEEWAKLLKKKLSESNFNLLLADN